MYSVNFVELPKSTGKCVFKLSVRNNAKCLISMNGKKKRIERLEWNGMMVYRQMVYNICIEKNTFKLQTHDILFDENETYMIQFQHIPTLFGR